MADRFLSIGKAAEMLGVSIDTLRRWEESGKITASRLDGKNRYFKLNELEKLKFGDSLSVSEAAERLSMSSSSLRRLSDEGEIKVHKSSNGYRRYEIADIEKFVNNEGQFSRQALATDIAHPSKADEHAPSIRVELLKVHRAFKRIWFLLRFTYIPVFSIVVLFVLSCVSIGVSFVRNPEATAKFFGFGYLAPKTQVLGLRSDSGLLNIASGVMQVPADLTLRVIRAIDPQVVEGVQLPAEQAVYLATTITKGDQGPQGERGEIGLRGLTGLTGATGAGGSKGDKGDTGNTGSTGSTGATGAAGATGSLSGTVSSLLSLSAGLDLIYDSGDYHDLQVASDGGLTWTANGSDADLNFDFSTATDGDFSVNSDDLFVDTSSGNVGIGTTSPAHLLSVNGDASIGDYVLGVQSDGFYIGRTRIAENQWQSNLAKNWIARDSSRAWVDIDVSGTGEYQTAVVLGGQIYTSFDYGVTWTARDSSRNWRAVAISNDGKYQTVGINTGQIYISSDYGVTWTAVDSTRVWVGMAMSGNGKYQTAAANDAGGGSGDFIYISSDYGATWTAKGSQLSWDGVGMSDNGKYQTAFDSGNQIYTSSDYGATWTARDSSRSWNAVALSATGLYQTAVVGSGQVYTSSDYGVTWMARDSSRNWQDVDVSGDGKQQAAVVANGQIYTSSDFGVTWVAKATSRVWGRIAMSSDGVHQTALVANGQIYTSEADLNTTGSIGIGTVSPNDALEVLSTSDSQLRLAYDTSSYHALQVASDGGLTWSALGTDADLNFDFSGATDGDFSVNSSDFFVDTSASRVGVGTASLSSKFTVSGSDSTANGLDAAIQITNSGSGGANWYIRSGATGNNTPAAGISIADDNGYRFVIDNAGLVGIGTITPGSKLQIVADSLDTTGDPSQNAYAQLEITSVSHAGSNNTTPGNLQLGFDHRPGTFGAGFIQTVVNDLFKPPLTLQPASGSVGVGTLNPDQGIVEVKGGTVCVDTNSDDNATSCIATESDARLKDNIQSLSLDSSLDKILALDPVSFDWRVDDPEVLKHYPLISRFVQDPHSIGLIAQDVMSKVPEAISKETVGDDEVQYYQLDYNKFIPLLVGAVKAQQLQMDSLSSSLATVVEGTGGGQVLGASIDKSMKELTARVEALEKADRPSLANLWETVDELVINAKLTFNNLTVFKGNVEFNENTVGQVTIPAGAIAAEVHFSKPFEMNPIVSISPSGLLGSSYYLSQVTIDGFTVSIKEPLTSDAIFTWTAFRRGEKELETVIIIPSASPTPTVAPLPTTNPLATPDSTQSAILQSINSTE